MKLHVLCARAILMAATAAVCVPSTPCFAADSPWNGMWKYNETKSKTTGDTFTVSMTAAGKFHSSSDGIIEYDYACDGTPYPTLAGRTVTCTGTPEAGMEEKVMFGGKPLRITHETLSADGNTLHSTYVSTRPDGSSVTGETTYKRIAGTKGLVGTWKDVKDQSTNSSVILIKMASGAMHCEEPAYSESFDAKVDGTPAAVSGPTVPPGAMVVIRKESAMKVHYSDMLNGKTVVEGTETVSAGGKTLTREEWIPGRESEKAILVYDKQ